MKDKREHIINIAVKLFNQNGFHATPTSLIAKKSGVATGTLFNYFKTKEDLINSIYLESKLSLLKSLRDNLKENATTKEALKSLYTGMLKWSFENGEFFKFFLNFSLSSYIKEEIRNEIELQFKDIFKVMEQGLNSGELKNYDPQLIMAVSWGMISQAAQYYLRFPEKYENAKKHDFYFQVYWDALKK